MHFNVAVRISYRSREMLEDQALALAAVQEYVAMLPDDAVSWQMDSSNGFRTPAAARWATVLAKADIVARKAATVGWVDPRDAEIEINILLGRLRTGFKTDWADVFGGLGAKSRTVD